MRIRDLKIENFRKFRQPIHLTGFEDGLNLVSEANEVGKSTLLEALRAVLFERHGSKSERIQSFRPHGDEVAPTVELTFQIGEDTWMARKRFLQKPEVILQGPKGRASGDEAEERLQSLLGFARAGSRGADADSRGTFGLLWVEQGRSFVLDAPGQTARRSLEAVLAGEVGAVTGGRRVASVMQAVQKSLADFLTATGRPTGRLLAAQKAAETAAADAEKTQQELAQFDDELNRLEAKRNELRRLVRDLTDPEHAEQLTAIEADIAKAKNASLALASVKAGLSNATANRQRLEAQQATRVRLRDELAETEGKRARAQSDLDTHRQSLAVARDTQRAAASTLEKARETSQAVEATRKAALSIKAAEDRRRLTAAAFARLDGAEAIDAELRSNQTALASMTMTEAAEQQLLKLERAVEKASSAATAGAATLQLALLPTAPEIRRNGQPIEANALIAVTESQVLALEGIGTVTVHPAVGSAAALAALQAAQQDLTSFLRRVGYATPSDARAAARTRSQTEQTVQRLAVQLASACPADPALKIAAGIEPLRLALGHEARPQDDAAATRATASDEELQASWDTARTAERDAEGRRDMAIETLGRAEVAEVQWAGRLAAIDADRKRLGAALSRELEAMSDEALAERLPEARTDEARAVLLHDEARRAAEGLDEEKLTRRRQTLIKRQSNMQEERLVLVREIAALDERVKTLGGAGPATRAAAAAEAADASRIAHMRLQEEAEVLRLLDKTIKDAQSAASRRYLEPITRRVAPNVARLLPNADLVFGEDYVPRLLNRGGYEEATDALSKGTQEQLAVLARIAFADLLIEKGQPASLVLDDALVFADDDRFDTMLEILSDAAKRMQVIILSCRTSSYRALDAKRIRIG